MLLSIPSSKSLRSSFVRAFLTFVRFFSQNSYSTCDRFEGRNGVDSFHYSIESNVQGRRTFSILQGYHASSCEGSSRSSSRFHRLREDQDFREYLSTSISQSRDADCSSQQIEKPQDSVNHDYNE